MHLLITGGCGFIGSHFVRYFLERYPQAKVTNVDWLTYAAHPDTNQSLRAQFPERYTFVHGDISKAEPLTQLLERENYSGIINFAAESHVDRSILNSQAFVQTNILGTENLLLLSRPHNIRLVQVSTDEVYGSLDPKAPASCEEDALQPTSPYAASKAAADLLVLANHRTYGQDVVITRSSNNYGPYQFPEKLIPLVIANALEAKPIPVYGDGSQIRDWIFVTDHCEGIIRAFHDGKSGEIYHFGASETRTNLTIVQLILEQLGVSTDLIQFVGDRPAHDRRYHLSAEKAKKLLGWRPQIEFSKALEHTTTWYRENTSWWKKVRGDKFGEYYRANYDSKFQNRELVS